MLASLDPDLAYYSNAAGGGGIVAPLVRRPGDAEDLIPGTIPAAAGVLIPAGTPYGTFGAWTAIDAAAGVDRFLNQAYARRSVFWGATGSRNNGMELGYGAGPTTLDFFRDLVFAVDPTPDSVGFPQMAGELTWRTKIPAGQAFLGRITDGVAAVNWETMFTGWSGAVPAFTQRAGTPAGAGRYYPTNTTSVNTSSGASPAWGAWALVVDPAPNDMLVRHIAIGNLSAGDPTRGLIAVQVGIGTGGVAGSEVPAATFLIGRGQSPAVIDPPAWVLAGERLSIRTQAFAGALAAGFGVKVIDL